MSENNETNTPIDIESTEPLTKKQKFAKVMMNPYTIALATSALSLGVTAAQIKMKRADSAVPVKVVFPEGYDPFNLNPIAD